MAEDPKDDVKDASVKPATTPPKAPKSADPLAALAALSGTPAGDGLKRSNAPSKRDMAAAF